MRWIFILVGGFLGAASFDAEGILPGLVVGWMAFEQLTLRRRLGDLERRLNDAPAIRSPGAGRVTEVADIPPVAEPTEPSPEEVAPPQAIFELPTEPTVEPAPAFQPYEPVAEPPRRRQRTALDDALVAARQFLFGGNLLVRAGVVILFFALSFLVKLAVDNNLFPIELRLAGVAAVGIGLIGAGWRFKEQRRGYGLSLQGGGLGVLYLTIYAAFKLYALIPPGAALLLLLATALLGAAIAILEDAEGLAVIGFLGGFLAPVLASTGSGDHVLLFAFYGVLNLGLLVIAWFKPWRWLNRAGFYSTFGIAGLWGAGAYRPELFASTEPFLIGFFLCYFVLSILYATRQRRPDERPVDGTLVFALPVVAFTLQGLLVEPFAYGLAWSSLAFGAFYTIAAWMVYRRSPALLRLLVESFAAIALGLLTMTIPFALDATWVGAGWALEGAALAWLGRRQHQLRLRLFGAALQVAAGVFFIQALDALTYDQREALMAVLNPMTLGFATLTLAALFTAYQIHRREDAPAWEGLLEPLFLVVGIAWMAGGGLFELTRLLGDKPALDAFIAYLALTAALLALVGSWRSWHGIRLAARYPLPLFYAALLPYLFLGHPLEGYGLPAWVLALALAYLVLRRTDTDLAGLAGALYHVFLFWLGVGVVSWSLAVWMEDLSGSHDTAWTLLGLMAPLLAASLLALQGLRRGWWPFAAHRRAYLAGAVGFPLFDLWIASFYSLGLPAAATPLPYLPLLNPLDLVLGFAAISGIAWYREARLAWPVLAEEPARKGLTWLLALTVFLWLNAAIARSVHFWAGVSYETYALAGSGLFQAALSICWTLLAVAAMAFAHRHQHRTVWFASMALLGVVVVKLFVVDLSSLTLAMKVVSFMVVGVLLLIIGYVAPVPPARPSPDPPTDPTNA